MLDSGIRTGRRLGWLDPVRLDRQTLMDRAAEQAGLDDFGDGWFEKPFDVLLDSVNAEAKLNAAGEVSAQQPVSYTHLTLPTIYSV